MVKKVDSPALSSTAMELPRSEMQKCLCSECQGQRVKEACSVRCGSETEAALSWGGHQGAASHAWTINISPVQQPG